MKKNLKILLSVVLLIVILGITGIVNAFSVRLKLESSSKLKVGDIVEVTLKISNIDAGNGIDAISATIEYDKNVFDEVTQESFVGINSWNIGTYSTDSQIFTILRGSKVNTISDVLKISLRVKSTTNVDSTTIKLKNITASGGAVSDGGTGDIEIVETEVKVTKEADNSSITNTVVTNEITNQNVTKINSITKNNESTTEKLPQTGEDFGIIVAVILVGLVSVLSYIKYRNVNIK